MLSDFDRKVYILIDTLDTISMLDMRNKTRRINMIENTKLTEKEISELNGLRRKGTDQAVLHLNEKTNEECE